MSAKCKHHVLTIILSKQSLIKWSLHSVIMVHQAEHRVCLSLNAQHAWLAIDSTASVRLQPDTHAAPSVATTVLTILPAKLWHMRQLYVSGVADILVPK